jgi:dynein heavy chain
MPKKGSPKRGRSGRTAAAGAYSDILAELDEESKASDASMVQAYQQMPSLSSFAPSGERVGGRKVKSAAAPVSPVADPAAGRHVSSSATDPKVLVPYKPVAGQPPRRVEIERRKRLYAAQDIEKLLLDLGLEYNYGTFRGQRIASQLPLSAFDSTDFEQQTPAEWLAKGMVEGEQQGVPARALRMPDPRQEQGTWQDCLVKGWNAEASKFSVEWADTGASSDVPRIHILFLAEDPFLFAQRVVVAHTNRHKTESQLRYNLYIDCMPTDDMPTLDSEQLHRVLALALQSQMLQANQNMLDTKSLINEVNLDFSRTMNKIIFDMHSSKGLMPGLNFDLPDDGDALTVPPPATGTVALELAPDEEGKAVQGDFGSVFGNFAFKTLFTKQEVYNAIEAVAAQCTRLASIVIFKTGLIDPCTPDRQRHF